MKVLAVVNGNDAPPGSFAEVVEERGHTLETWVPAAGRRLRRTPTMR